MSAAAEPDCTRVRVVTDSVSDVPSDLAAALGVTVVPVTVRLDSREYRDRVDITMQEFMARLARTTEPVRTSQPSPGEFIQAFRSAGEGGRPVVAVQCSSKFSGTYQSACIARDILTPEGYRIDVVDTKSGSMGQGWAVIGAARAALTGLSFERVAQVARDISARVKVFLTLDTLSYLQRNGRLGAIRAAVGSVLGLKPIITVRDGELCLADAAFGAERAMHRLVGAIGRAVHRRARVALAVAHVAAAEKAEALRRELERLYDVVESLITETGPAIAANVGPGGYGAMLYEVE